MNKAEEACTELLRIFGNIPEIFDQNWEKIDLCNKETEDILHEIELSENQTTTNGYKLYKALREVRRERRRCKNENEALQPIVDILKQQENLRLRLYKVHSIVKEITRQQEERQYTPRVLKDAVSEDVEAVKELEAMCESV